MKVLVKDYKEFKDKLKNIDDEFEVDINYWVIWGKPAARKQYRKGDEFIEIAIYYNYQKDLVTRISKNRVLSEGEGCIMTTPIQTIQEDFEKVKQASKKNILEKVAQVKNIDLKQWI